MYVKIITVDHILNYSVVYRISWLRAKARYTRWKEEHILVQHEMRWTVAWFEHRAMIWQTRFDEVDDEDSSDGLQCYALKQSNIWKRLGEHASKLFTTTLRTEVI